VTCRTRAEACQVLAEATKILSTLVVTLNVEKTRIVHVTQGFEFLGYKIKRGSRSLALPSCKIRSGVRSGDLYAYPRQKSIQHFKDQLRQRTLRKAPVRMPELIERINPVIRGWGQYYCKAHVRKLFARLDRWILRRLWSHRFKRWRCRGWQRFPERQLYAEMGLVRLVFLIPSLNLRR
jgi:RNA-directed DNA polymerase